MKIGLHQTLQERREQNRLSSTRLRERKRQALRAKEERQRTLTAELRQARGQRVKMLAEQEELLAQRNLLLELVRIVSTPLQEKTDPMNYLQSETYLFESRQQV